MTTYFVKKYMKGNKRLRLRYLLEPRPKIKLTGNFKDAYKFFDTDIEKVKKLGILGLDDTYELCIIKGGENKR